MIKHLWGGAGILGCPARAWPQGQLRGLSEAGSQEGAGAVLFDTTFYLLCAEGNLLKDKTCERKVYVREKLD